MKTLLLLLVLVSSTVFASDKIYYEKQKGHAWGGWSYACGAAYDRAVEKIEKKASAKCEEKGLSVHDMQFKDVADCYSGILDWSHIMIVIRASYQCK